VSDKAAALLTLANPNMTNTMLGKQHMDAIIVEVEINLMRDFESFPVSSICTDSSPYR
tara:strand:- start:555 stop:728 length:174 start_codon:yes stop_codon:yes gene_type:complete